MYGAEGSKDTVATSLDGLDAYRDERRRHPDPSTWPDRVIDEMTAWWARPLEPVYAGVFTDAIMVKVN